MRSPDGVIKVCSRCHKTKLVGEFTNCKASVDGLSVECRACQKQSRRLRYLENRKPRAQPKPVADAIATAASEEWREIEGFGGKYQISNMGRVASYAYGYWKVMTPRRTRRGQMEYVNLSHNGEKSTRKIHRLVLETFVGPCPDGMECCHGNGVAFDNRLTNLRWGTHSENQLDKRKHGTAGLLSPNEVREIRHALRAGASQKSQADRFGVDQSHISKIANGKKWRNLE